MKRDNGYIGRIVAVLALAVLPRLGPAQPSRAAAVWPAAAQATYEREVATLARAIAARLHRPLGLRTPVTLHAADIKVRSSGKLSAAYAWATLGPADCALHFNPAMQHLHGRDWSVVVAHEVYHCFEDGINPDTNPWIAEGQAEWVGEDVAGPSSAVSAPAWNRYLEHPEIPLFAREYDAIGFYAHLAESCVNPWKILDAMLGAAKSGDRGAYAAATSRCTSGTAAPFLDSWASGLFRDPSRGRDWNATGPAMPPASVVNPVPRAIALANGRVAPPLAAAPFSNGIYTIDSGADVVQVAATGHARLSDGNVDRVLDGDADFCTRAGGCSCPPGSSYQGPPLTPLQSSVALALTGGPDDAGTRVALAGIALDSLCKKKPAPLPLGRGDPLPDPCKLVTPNDVQRIVGPSVDLYIRGFATNSADRRGVSRACEYAVVVMGAGAPASTGAILLSITRNVPPRVGTGKPLTGWGTAVRGLGAEAYLSTPDGYARLIVFTAQLSIVIQVTMGTNSSARIARETARVALSRL